MAETTDHAYAQYFVGRMYASGQGVDKNLETAAKWYRKASELGVADAQYRLGKLYSTGDGVPRDMESAYGWYTVAAHLGNPKAVAAIEQSAGLLSPSELEEAQALSAELIEKYGKTTQHHGAYSVSCGSLKQSYTTKSTNVPFELEPGAPPIRWIIEPNRSADDILRNPALEPPTLCRCALADFRRSAR